MRTISSTEASKSFESRLDNVADDADITIITREGNSDAVVMSLSYFNSLMETINLLESPANAASLTCSIKKSKNRQTFERELLESGD